jgi:hypothetical protein
VTPEDFLTKWGCKRSHLSLMLGYSQSTINHWFSNDPTREPPPDVLERLNEIDAVFRCWQIQDEQVPHLRSIYDELTNK